MAYAHDMGHDIPNDEYYCPVRGEYGYCNSKGNWTSFTGGSFEEELYNQVIKSDNWFEEQNRMNSLKSNSNPKIKSDIIPRTFAKEDDELYGNPNWFEEEKSYLDDQEKAKKWSVKTVKTIQKDYVFTFGKYKGKTLKDIKDKDRPYVLWALKNVPFFAESIIDLLKY